MNRLFSSKVLVTAAMSLALGPGLHAWEAMETRDTRIGKLVFEKGYVPPLRHLR